MTSLASPFRGYNGIREITERMDKMVLWWEEQQLIAPRTYISEEPKTFTLKRVDYDLIRRWPKAGKMLNVDYGQGGEIWYRGFRLRPDTGPGRYEIHEKPTTVEIT